MSPRSWKLRVEDILENISDIESFIDGFDYEKFCEDKKTFYAVIRALEIIGEAASHVPQGIQQKYPKIPWVLIKDFRNILAHQYFGVDNKIVWQTIRHNLTALKVDLQVVLKDIY